MLFLVLPCSAMGVLLLRGGLGSSNAVVAVLVKVTAVLGCSIC
jgi:hypothetical protein